MISNTEQSLKVLSAQINLIESTHGVQACEDYTSALYRAKFRSNPVKASDFFVDGTDFCEAASELREELMDKAFESENQAEINAFHNDDSDDRDDTMFYALDSLHSQWYDRNADKFPLISLDGETLVVSLCNYKGEPDGFALYESAKSLKIFVSKHNYRSPT